MPKPTEQAGYEHFIKKLIILGIFILGMVVLVPFFYGWVNGKAHQQLCGAVGISSTWSCGLILRDPNILQGYLQLKAPASIETPGPQELPSSPPQSPSLQEGQ